MKGTMKKKPPKDTRIGVRVSLPVEYANRIKRVQRIMLDDPSYRGSVSSQTAVRYALDKLAGEVAGG